MLRSLAASVFLPRLSSKAFSRILPLTFLVISSVIVV